MAEGLTRYGKGATLPPNERHGQSFLRERRAIAAAWQRIALIPAS